MEFSRLGIKLFATDPNAVRMKDFVPIFHSWIQRQCVENHQLIDVHDYSHVHHGPGILLVAHEGNFSIDMAEGKPGLVYFRKQPAGNTSEDVLRASLKAALQATALIGAEPSLEGRIRFRRDELLVIANDRLLVPNDAATFTELKPMIARVSGGKGTVTHLNPGTKDRLAVLVQGVVL